MDVPTLCVTISPAAVVVTLFDCVASGPLSVTDVAATAVFSVIVARSVVIVVPLVVVV